MSQMKQYILTFLVFGTLLVTFDNAKAAEGGATPPHEHWHFFSEIALFGGADACISLLMALKWLVSCYLERRGV